MCESIGHSNLLFLHSIDIKHSSAVSVEITGEYPKSKEIDIDTILKRDF